MPSKPTITRINRTVIQFDQIPSEIRRDLWFGDHGFDIYVPYKVKPADTQKRHLDYKFNKWLLENWPELEGRFILIEVNG